MTEESPVPLNTRCAWCDAALVGAQRGEAFCCQGCESAAAIVRGAGLDDWFQRREAAPPRPGAHSRGWDRVPTQSGDKGSLAATLCIDGLRCGSCVWLTEHVLLATPGVEAAQVSYASGRAQIAWDPARIGLGDIAARIEGLGYRPRPADAPVGSDRDLLLRLGVAAFAAMNVMLLSVGVYLGWWAGMDERFAALFRWSNLVLATPAATWSAAPFFRSAVAGLRARVLHMDLPISLGVGVLYVHGLVATLRGQDAYLDSLVMLVALLLAGRVAEQRGRTRAADAAASLAARAPRVVRRIGPRGPEEVAPEALVPGDHIEVAAGEEFGADGVVFSGQGSAKMALVTGESEPVSLLPGAEVVAGAVLSEGAVQVLVRAAGQDTLLQRMARQLRDAADRPIAPTPADQVAPVFTAATLVVAALTFGVRAYLFGATAALPATIAVLVVACPCALALSGPVARAAGLGAAARRGLLLRSGDALSRLAEVDLVLLDKTGTLTVGEPEVVEASDATLRLAAGLERNSIHPIARAIVSEAVRRGLPIPLSTAAVEVVGEGISGQIDGLHYRVYAGGAGEVLLEGPDFRDRIVLRDRVREDAARTVARLRRAGLRVVLLSGDHRAVAERIGAEVGVDEVIAEARPDDKVAILQRLRAQGHKVLFVGDGLNDGPALAVADASIAMGSGAASSVLVADGVVAGGSLGGLAAGLWAARAATAAMHRNLRRSLVYNISAVAFAAFGLINPLIAAILMPLSSALVLVGAMGTERAVAAEERL